MATHEPSGICFLARPFSEQHQWADMNAVYACCYCGTTYEDYVDKTSDYSQFSRKALENNLNNKVADLIDAVQHHQEDLSVETNKAFGAAMALLYDFGYTIHDFNSGTRR